MSALLTLAMQLIDLLRGVPPRFRGAVYGVLAAGGAIALLIVCLPWTRAWFGLEHAPPPLVILVAVFNFVVSLSSLLAHANLKEQPVRPKIHQIVVHGANEPHETARELTKLLSEQNPPGRSRHV
ncbi:hypothetical protein GCM10028801_41430 [Nocardioides maradonensis]